MNIEDIKRINNDAEALCKEKYTPKIAEFAIGIYLIGATVEHERMIQQITDLKDELEYLKADYQKLLQLKARPQYPPSGTYSPF